jgi:predicted nucleic acid-binding protein
VMVIPSSTPCCVAAATQPCLYDAIQIYEAYHLIMWEFLIYTGDKALLRIFRPIYT